MSRHSVIFAWVTLVALMGPATCRAEDETVEGTVAAGNGGRRAIQTVDGALVPVSNPERPRALPMGVRILATGPRGPQGLRVDRVQLGVLLDWQKTKERNVIPGDPASLDAAANLDTAAEELDKAVRDAMKQGALGVKDDAMDVALSTMIDACVALYKAGSDPRFPDFAAVKTIYSQQLVEYIAAQRQHRRSVDNFSPEIYPRMYETAESAVGVVEKGAPQPHGSGVLIGTDLVLTCGHNVGEREPWQLEVWFRYDGKLRDAYRVARIIKEDWSDRFGKALDFALLVLETNARGKSAAKEHPPARISLRPPRRDDPVYAVGHPEGDRRTLHDNAYVRLPFCVDDPTRLRLEMIVVYELEPLQNKMRAQYFEEFRASYKRAPSGGYEFFSKRFSFRPVIGIDTHTFHGDSGAPVFDRGSLGVIGIVDDGAREQDRPVRPSGYRFFEGAVPITLIVAALNEKLPKWKEDFHVQFIKEPGKPD
jgi:hypothetical protein